MNLKKNHSMIETRRLKDVVIFFQSVVAFEKKVLEDIFIQCFC